MSCQILSALLLEALSARLLYSAARWRRGCSHRGCSRRGGLDSVHVSREVSVTIWGRKKNQTHPTPAVLMGLNHAAATWCCSGRHNSFIRVRMRGIVASTAGTCALCTHRWVCTLKILGISVVCLEWVQRECGVTDLTVGYAHMLGSSTSGSWRNTHTQRFVFVIWLSGVTSTQSLNNASQVIPPAFVPPPIDTNNCCRLCGATPRPFRDSCSVAKTPEPCLMCLDEKEALAWYKTSKCGD